MEPCITSNLKDMLLRMCKSKRPHEKMEAIIEDPDIFPLCEPSMFKGGGSSAAAEATKKREIAERWPGAIYVKPDGTHEEWDSASKLYTHLTGKKVSGSVCDESGRSCRAATILDNFRFHGYLIQGNGEDPPKSDPEKPFAAKAATDEWKQHLLDENKKLYVIDPKFVPKQEGRKVARKAKG